MRLQMWVNAALWEILALWGEAEGEQEDGTYQCVCPQRVFQQASAPLAEALRSAVESV